MKTIPSLDGQNPIGYQLLDDTIHSWPHSVRQNGALPKPSCVLASGIKLFLLIWVCEDFCLGARCPDEREFCQRDTMNYAMWEWICRFCWKLIWYSIKKQDRTGGFHPTERHGQKLCVLRFVSISPNWHQLQQWKVSRPPGENISSDSELTKPEIGCRK